MACEVCEIIKSGKGLVYEDDKVAAFIRQKSVAEGHIAVVPKIHLPIFENVPDSLSAAVFGVANILQAAAIKAFGATAANIVVNNGMPAGQTEPHFMVHVIPRKENDGLSLDWQPQKTDEGRLAEVLALYGDKQEEEINDSEENYLLKSLNRIP